MLISSDQASTGGQYDEADSRNLAGLLLSWVGAGTLMLGDGVTLVYAGVYLTTHVHGGRDERMDAARAWMWQSHASID
eukprot:266719-Chlamydomonas_euryale.AAC.7